MASYNENYSNFVNDLIYVRNTGDFNSFVSAILEADKLKITTEEAKAFIIQLAFDALGVGEQSDVVLCSLRLLDGYQKLKGVTERRVAYMEETNYLGKKISPNRSESASGARSIKEKSKDLIQEENGYYQLMENYFVRIVDRKAYLENAIKTYLSPATGQSRIRRARLPKPSYRIGKPMPINNLPLENGWFMGREDVLEAISDKFANGERILLLHGMGGAGKTQVALRYAYAHSDDYDEIAWIDASSRLTLEKSCRNYLHKVDPCFAESIESALDSRFLSYFEFNRRYLLIYDNADYLDDDINDSGESLRTVLESYIPKIGGNILITTRCNGNFHGAGDIAVPIFDISTAATYLAKRTGLPADNVAEELAEKLGCLPLALEYAAAYIKTQNISYQGYIDKWKRNGAKLFDQDYAVMTVRRAFHITLDKLGDSNPEMQAVVQLLQICSVWSSNTIRLDLMYETDFELPEPLEAMLSDEISRDELVHRAMQYSLIQRDGEHLLMHPLLQEVIRDEMTDSIRTIWLDISFRKLFESKCNNTASIVQYYKSFTHNSHGVVEINESDEADLLDAIINLKFVIELIIKYHSREKLTKIIDDFMPWADMAINHRIDEYYMVYPTKMGLLDLELIPMMDKLGTLRNKANDDYRHMDYMAMMANACLCCGKYEMAVNYTNAFLDISFLWIKQNNRNLHGWLLTCDQVFGQTLNFGSEELLKRIFSLRCICVSKLYGNNETIYDYFRTAIGDEDFYSHVSLSIGRPIMFKTIKEPENGGFLSAENNFAIYVTDGTYNVLTPWGHHENCIAIMDVYFETVIEAEKRLPEILLNPTTDWRVIALPEDLCKKRELESFLNKLNAICNMPHIMCSEEIGLSTERQILSHYQRKEDVDAL